MKSAGIIIDAVLPSGLIEEWNASHELSERVMAGDRIIALDGQQMPGRLNNGSGGFWLFAPG